MRALLVAALAAAALGCQDADAFTEPQVLGQIEIDAATLNRGRTAYRFNCASCHGADGDGRGATAGSLGVAPRDFRTARFKFVGNAALPADDDLVDLIRNGLGGTRMVAPHLPDTMLRDIVHYIKTFSPPSEGYRRPDGRLAGPLVVSDDPWGSDPDQAVARGREVYHGVASCQQCHDSYAEDVPRPAPSRADAPDLAADELRVAHHDGGLYRVIAYGIRDSGMPAWKGSLSEEDLWALAHFVRSIR